MQQFAGWKIEAYPGYFGRKRDEIQAGWDAKYGKGNWNLAWVIVPLNMPRGSPIIIPKEMAVQLYEDAYVEHFKDRADDLDWIISTASDVYDNDPENVNSGLDYSIQTAYSNHLQDIAVRRALIRLGYWFQGDHLVQIRGKQTEGARLAPYNIKFHMPHIVIQRPRSEYGNFPDWIADGSVEDFYQRNKVLLVKQP